jgi:hypothetical protein
MNPISSISPAATHDSYLSVTLEDDSVVGANNEKLYLWDLESGLPDTLDQFISQEIGINHSSSYRKQLMPW